MCERTDIYVSLTDLRGRSIGGSSRRALSKVGFEESGG